MVNQTKPTLLAVDDDPENLAVLGELLDAVCRLLTAASGTRAIELAAEEPAPDLILLDVVMPDMDGHTVLSRLKSARRTREIPVILVTDTYNFDDELRGLELGAVDCIARSLHPAVILARIQTRLALQLANRRLREHNARLKAAIARRTAESELVLECAAEGIFGVNAAGNIHFINRSAAAILGYGRRELLGTPASDTLDHSSTGMVCHSSADFTVFTAPASGTFVRRREALFLRKDGSPLPVEFSATPVHAHGQLVGAVVTFIDVSERREYLALLEHFSDYDALTRLPNRKLLTERLARTVESSRATGAGPAAITLDIDRFSEINEVFGAGFGDQVLQEIADALRTLPCQPDAIARIAADEFVALAENERFAETFANAVLTRFSRPLKVGGRDVHISFSIGIAVYERDGKDSDALLNNSTAAMLRAKADGGSCVRFYAAEMNAHSAERMQLTNELHDAISRDEFVLYYQPQVSMRSGEVVGCEALLRWRHPRRGLVPPAEFVPLAEQTGMIVAIGEWVLRTACRQSKQWKEAGLPSITMAVNVSAQQFAAQDVVALAADVLRETGLDPNTLELELTERTLMADAETFIKAVERLKALHVTLSIDDFGTGFSSLSYLKRFAVDRLKIDMSFVRDITHDAGSATIALAIISLAHTLNLSVIAEGVENAAQLTFLRTRDCDEMQGFYFSKPLPAAEFESMLRERRRLTFPAFAGRPSETVLLVDDEPAILAALKRLLRREGYTILTASGGEEGLEQMARYDVGVVISDSRMPGMDGADFLRRVSAIYPDAVRMMLSGHSDLKAVTDAVNTGELYRFLTKPWDDRELVEILRNAFRHYETRRQGAPRAPRSR